MERLRDSLARASQASHSLKKDNAFLTSKLAAEQAARRGITASKQRRNKDIHPDGQGQRAHISRLQRQVMNLQSELLQMKETEKRHASDNHILMRGLDDLQVGGVVASILTGLVLRRLCCLCVPL